MKTVSQSLYFLYWQQQYQIFGSPAIRNCGSKLYAEKLLIPCKKGSKGAAAGKQLWIFRRFSTAEEYDSSAGRRIGRQQQQPGGKGGGGEGGGAKGGNGREGKIAVKEARGKTREKKTYNRRRKGRQEKR